ncbi:hypothetical protein CHREV_118 [Choristoneura rosaceana entomopoxvirus 'L']|uniref:N1R/p28-like protein n=1 Tax=Choristoneura rosaceana entomopoxvirus 'L' TaxID=1293539 RepID=A0ABM9QKF1_9POXV|nr:hypothetical protein CHREV_118 [Choristoneura rosaceana entomopoxvirus 'L']CCU56020.1 hypothetical protein CHREV_118 [Choristoneura rosaceana entomopoxvirus 'L']
MTDSTTEIMEFDVEENDDKYVIAIDTNIQNDNDDNIMMERENVYYYTNHENKVII